jgi:drug/metabolite transporter (DMT)-like permease
MLGATSYFLISADQSNGLPPLVLAAGGLVVGTVALALLGALGVLPVQASTTAATYAGRSIAWWVPLLVLGVVTAALSYTTGIAAGRRLGSRLASFVALLEVVAGVGFAWVLLDELPRTVQLLGGLLILTGVVGVKLGEKDVVTQEAG